DRARWFRSNGVDISQVEPPPEPVENPSVKTLDLKDDEFIFTFPYEREFKDELKYRVNDSFYDPEDHSWRTSIENVEDVVQVLSRHPDIEVTETATAALAERERDV